MVSQGLIDADDYSEMAFRNAAVVWEALPIEERKWKMADNITKVDCPTLADLNALCQSMLVARGLRAAALHAACDYMKASIADNEIVTKNQMEAIYAAI
jgi:hypothetical protein